MDPQDLFKILYIYFLDEDHLAKVIVIVGRGLLCNIRLNIEPLVYYGDLQSSNSVLGEIFLLIGCR